MRRAAETLDARAIVGDLCRWFARAARDLPWRGRRRTGYRALVVEAMLQQTQVSRVVPAYLEFLRRFPTVQSLAAAPEQSVLAAWKGLGYYRRARSLHAAAQSIVRDFHGRVPRDAATLRALPGVGRYTAGSIASIVYGRREPLVDGNVARVLARLWADAEADPWVHALALVSVAPEPGVFNEALMELGALVCTPASPRCGACPIAAHCRARAAGIQGSIPPPKRPARRRREHHHAVVIRRGGRTLLEQRPDRGMWSGMWQVPTVESPRRLDHAQIRSALRAPAARFVPCGTFLHQTTDRTITFHVYTATTSRRPPGAAWVGVATLELLPMSNAQWRVLRLAQADAPASRPAAPGRRLTPRRSAAPGSRNAGLPPRAARGR